MLKQNWFCFQFDIDYVFDEWHSAINYYWIYISIETITNLVTQSYSFLIFSLHSDYSTNEQFSIEIHTSNEYFQLVAHHKFEYYAINFVVEWQIYIENNEHFWFKLQNDKINRLFKASKYAKLFKTLRIEESLEDLHRFRNGIF